MSALAADRVLTFYPRRGDGSALAFSIAEVKSDAAARHFAQQLFAVHDSAVQIDVFQNDALIAQYRRSDLASANPAVGPALKA